MKTLKEGILLCFMSFCFWGMLYPQFSLVEETYNCTEVKKDPRQDFVAILNAKEGELQFRSKLWKIWKENLEKNGAVDSLWKKRN